MKITLYLVMTDASLPITLLAQAIEARGFESIWVPVHSLVPRTGNTCPAAPR